MEVIRDNVHGDISIKETIINELIDTPEFQRLRRIIQLGGSQFVFPGACHTRFSHCIGVYHIINKFLDNKEISSHINSKDQLTVKIAGLLHDIGHGPFSHSFEKIASSQPHEKYTVDIILGDTNINKVLAKNGVSPEEVASVILGNHKNNIINSLISSQLDADRLDYLLRDSIYTGVNYANLDLNWIIRNSLVFEEKLVFKTKAMYAIEHYLLGRFYMFKQIYNHNVSKAFDQTLLSWFLRLKDLYNKGFQFKNTKVIDIFKDLLENKTCNLKSYLRLDDYSLMEFIKCTSNEDDKILKNLSDRIVNRKFLEVSSKLDEKEFEKYKNSYSKEEQKYYFKTIKNINSGIYSPSHSSKDEKIYLVFNNNLEEIIEKSQILKLTPKNIEKNLYVFLKDNVE
ncbi:HD superfamily phosphohydrolase [Spiroplasma helicoides]|uniref:HD superfamily phosphohydrolase n=1 Tax=Spiroplasma helicoides TaxID=216938 RepID=A0A1B3SMA4_9MOLU|nr:HD domain-containing protein [Spiroplasma helicoides]AOG61065.1 HD superfamily phosphohydrolase [Spiroplasma helicoides]